MPTESRRAVTALSDAFVAVAESVKPSVVQISVQRKGGTGTLRIPNGGNPFQGPNGGGIPKEFEDLLRDMFKQRSRPDFDQQQFGEGVQRGTGSGLIYDDRGHILTNNHVVDHAGKITVTFHDGVEAPATVVGTDPKSDVAVIKVENTSYRPLSRGVSSKLRVGELVMAVGSPFGLSQSVTTGIISATERSSLGINGDRNDTYESFLQTDAAVNPGNSGGPLVNMDGQVIGVNSAIVSGGRGNDGVGFAIPIDLASNVADKLIKDGKVNRARIGVAIKPLTPAESRVLGIDSKLKGALVQDVVPGSPADKAGLKSGDVITGFNGKEIMSTNSFRLNVAASDIGKPYELSYFRDGKEHRTSVVLGSSEKIVFDQERKSSDTKSEVTSEPAKTSIAAYGLELQPLTQELGKGLGLSKDVQGVLISSVKEGSPAEAAGLKPGMVISQVVRDKKIQGVKDVKDVQDVASKSNELMIYVRPGDGPGAFVTLTKPDKE